MDAVVVVIAILVVILAIVVIAVAFTTSNNNDDDGGNVNNNDMELIHIVSGITGSCYNWECCHMSIWTNETDMQKKKKVSIPHYYIT